MTGAILKSAGSWWQQQDGTSYIYQFQRFWRENGYFPCVLSPLKTINEEILLGKLLSSSALSFYVDKIEAKNHVSRAIRDRRLDKLKIPDTLRVYSDVEDFVRFLPREKCLVKASHGSGMSKIFDPKAGIDDSTKVQLHAWLNTDYSLMSGETCYKGIVPKIFPETLLLCSNGSYPMDLYVDWIRTIASMQQWFLSNRHKGPLL